jgi:hypothetical protein
MSATLPHGKVLIEEALTGVVYPRKKRIAQTPVSKLSKFKNPFCDDYESNQQWINKDKGVERLREFIRFGYMTASEVARRIDVHESTVNSWATGYEYREYKNWRAGFPSRGSVHFQSS